MGQTIRRYPILEVSVQTFSRRPVDPSGHERSLEGDIITARSPTAGIGRLEMHGHLWLHLEGCEENDRWLTEPCVGYQKRRYQIPLPRLAELFPWFDLARARDIAEVYQPFLLVDEDTGLYVIRGRPLDLHGIVFDTETRRYL